MDRQFKRIGGALVAGGLLMFTRMVPIFTVLPDDMAFPPESTQAMVRLAELAGLRWQLSHLMGLSAVVLFAIALCWHARYLVQQGWKRVGIALGVVATLAYTLFATALIVDGFVLPATIRSSANLEDVAEMHQLALSFFTPGVFLMFVSMGLVSSPMLHRVFHSRWLGAIGQIIAVVAVSAYLAGVTGPNWNVIQIAGSLMMLAFAWHLLVGLRALVKSTSEAASRSSSA